MFRGVIFDIDGVLEFQGKAYPGAIELVAELRRRGVGLVFVTNSTLKNRRSAAEKMNGKGFQVSPEEVITASFATAEYLRRIRPRSIYLMLAREGAEEFKEFTQDSANPEYVVVGDYRDGFSFDNLNYALKLLTKGAKLIGMQAELTDSSLGDLELNVGSWVGMLERAADVRAIYIGKPDPFPFELAMDRLKLPKEGVLAVGDRVSTDIAGAKGFGIASALVRTGEFKPEDLEGTVQPDYIFDAVQDLLVLFE